MLFAFIAVIIGSMLPWWQTAFGSQSGLGRWGVLTIWAAAVGLLGVFSIRPKLFMVLPVIGGLTAFGLALVELIRGSSECAIEDGAVCRPGAGLIIIGGAALYAVLRSIRSTMLQRAASE